MFPLGLPEAVMIGAAVLLVFGPKRLPELAKGLGQGIRGFRQALTDDARDETSDKSPEMGNLDRELTP